MKSKGNDKKEVSTEDDYASKEYWDKRYREGSKHEWYILQQIINILKQPFHIEYLYICMHISLIRYYTFETLEPLLQQYLGENQKVLEIGCGDVPLAGNIASIYDNIEAIGIDYSASVIKQLKCDLKGSSTASITYEYMDARKLKFNNQEFEFILDKGTIDAMLCDLDDKGFKNVEMIFKEMLRVSKLQSAIMIVSHMDVESEEFDSVLNNCILPNLDDYRNSLWKIEAHIVQNPSNVTKKHRGNKGSQTDKYGNIYVIKRRERKITRGMLQNPAEVVFEVKEYEG